jgi:hypothetical protein
MAAEANLSLLRQHAAVILARQAAMWAVKRRIQKEGRIKPGSLPLSTLSRLANEWLQDHPQLLATPPIPLCKTLLGRERARVLGGGGGMRPRTNAERSTQSNAECYSFLHAAAAMMGDDHAASQGTRNALAGLTPTTEATHGRGYRHSKRLRLH